MKSIYDGRNLNLKRLAIGVLALTSVFVAEIKLSAHAQTTAADAESVVVYPSITVTVNKSVVIRLPKRASRVSVTQPQIAEAVVVAPDQILINGKAVGTTSLVVWFEENKTRKK
ncbi:MAG TPA: pilus assembly protein N-terminal domain-containing protein [Candidatus Binatia bacterium]|jgi:pilus assembly protein CpaC